MSERGTGGRRIRRLGGAIAAAVALIGLAATSAGAVSSVPGAPTITDVTKGHSRGVVTFDAPADDGGSAPADDGGQPIIQYDVSCTSSDFGAPANASSPTSPVLVGVLTVNAWYTCTATAKNSVGTGNPSAAWGPFFVPPAPLTGAISGTVSTDPPAPLAGYCAQATEPSTGNQIANTSIAADGTYTLRALANGNYAVRFFDCAGGGNYHLPQWYHGVLATPRGDPVGDGATEVTVANGATTSGIDGVLTLGAHVTGTVTDTGGSPLEHVCVAALTNHNPAAVVSTVADGTYDLLAPAGTYVIGFFDCWGSSVVTQFWDHVDQQADATQLSLSIGTTTANIDARMTVGGGIRGTVIDAGTGDPLPNVCVNVTNADAKSGSRTDQNGHYDVGALPPGTYDLSFVDCANPASHGGTVVSGVIVTQGNTTVVDTQLTAAAPGSITGHLTTRYGTPLEGACIAVLTDLSGEPRFAGPTGPDGAYEVDGLGPGSYFVGFFACNGDNPGLPMPDPAHPGVTYHHQWYSNAWLGQGPDPYSDGATPVEVTSS